MARCSTLLILLLAFTPTAAGEKKQDTLVILNAAGREEKLNAWHFTTGVRKLGWRGGMPVLEFREEGSTAYVDGIVTLIPLASLKALVYDPDKKSVSATAQIAGGKDSTVAGTTRYAGFNHVVIEGEADLGALGAAAVKLSGGVPMGLRGLRFSSPQPAPEVKGKPATIVADDKDKSVHRASGLTGLYMVDGSYRILDELRFKKTVKIGFDLIEKLRRLPLVDKKQTTLDFEVTLTDGAQHNLSLLTRVDIDGKMGQLVGLLGQVPVGYKLFPPHTIGELRFDAKEQ